MADSSIPAGMLTLEDVWGEFNRQTFVIQQLLNRIQTATLVRVVACTNDGGLSPVGSVDVVPLINQVDSDGIATPHTTIFNVPYSRMQGGANAIILDPVAGDIGICAFASRDISKVKNTKAQANPGSFRKYDWGDALYIGGALNGLPSQFVRFGSDGITIHSAAEVKLEAPTVNIVATDVAVTSTTFTHNGVNIGSTHVHSDPQGGLVGPPQ